MRLFIVREVLYDYTGGMVAIKAKDLEEAREMFAKWVLPTGPADYAERYIREFNMSLEAGYYHSFKLADDDIHQPGVVTQVWGGG